MIINHLLWGDVFYEFNAVRFCSIDKPIQFRTLETAIRNFALGSGTVNKDHATIRMSSFNTTGVDIIAIFKIKAYSRMNGTNLHSPVELQPEMHAESHLEEHPMSLL